MIVIFQYADLTPEGVEKINSDRPEAVTLDDIRPALRAVPGLAETVYVPAASNRHVMVQNRNAPLNPAPCSIIASRTLAIGSDC